MYQALYRKYRPLYFSDVVGQDVIVKTLKQSINNNNFGHAYLFYGSRGTGKTSVSKILARSLNCLNPKDGEACGECNNCEISFNQNNVDIIEMDAASNNGVDEIRKIVDTLNLAPNSLKYKVYIVDEVHMLSTGAFNALLKTLEEPPEHVVFILATTELQKVPSTIVSRCQVFSFKRIPDNVIVDKLKDICKKEKIKVEEEVLLEIAKSSNGGMRDSLSILDKLFGFAGNKITIDDYYALNEIVSEDDIKKFCNYIFTGNVSEVVNTITKYNSESKNLVLIINQVINYLRNLLVSYYIKNNTIEYGLSSVISFNILFIENMFDIKRSDDPKVFIEMLIIKFINDNNLMDIETEEDKLTKTVENKENLNESVILEEQNDNISTEAVNKKEKENEELPKSIEKNEKSTKNVSNTNLSKKIININEIMDVRFINTLITAKKTIKNEEIKKFEKLRDKSFDTKEGYFANNLLDGVLQCSNEDCVVISFDHDAIVNQNLSDIEKINSFYNKVTGSNKKLCLISIDKWDSESAKFMEVYKNKNVDKLYKLQEEPIPIFEETKKDDIIGSSAMDLFDSDIVEIE